MHNCNKQNFLSGTYLFWYYSYSATPREKLQIKLAICPSHTKVTPGKPGYLSIHAADSLRHSKDIVKNFKLQLSMTLVLSSSLLLVLTAAFFPAEKGEKNRSGSYLTSFSTHLIDQKLKRRAVVFLQKTGSVILFPCCGVRSQVASEGLLSPGALCGVADGGKRTDGTVHPWVLQGTDQRPMSSHAGQ